MNTLIKKIIKTTTLLCFVISSGLQAAATPPPTLVFVDGSPERATCGSYAQTLYTTLEHVFSQPEECIADALDRLFDVYKRFLCSARTRSSDTQCLAEICAIPTPVSIAAQQSIACDNGAHAIFMMATWGLLYAIDQGCKTEAFVLACSDITGITECSWSAQLKTFFADEEICNDFTTLLFQATPAPFKKFFNHETMVHWIYEVHAQVCGLEHITAEEPAKGPETAADSLTSSAPKEEKPQGSWLGRLNPLSWFR